MSKIVTRLLLWSASGLIVLTAASSLFRPQLSVPVVTPKPVSVNLPANGEPRPAQPSNDPAADRMNTLVRRSVAAAAPDDRLDAIAELGNEIDSRAVQVLRSLLDDPLVAVREEAVESLGASAGPVSITALGYAISDENEMVRRLAIESLAAVGSEEAIGTLLMALSDNDPDLRLLAVDELADIDSEPARLALQLFLSDEHRNVRESAMEHLGLDL